MAEQTETPTQAEESGGVYSPPSEEELQSALNDCQDRVYEMIANLPCALLQYSLGPALKATATLKFAFDALGAVINVVNLAMEVVEGFPGSPIFNPLGGSAGAGAGIGIPPEGTNQTGGGLTWKSARTFNSAWSDILSKFDSTLGGRYPATVVDPPEEEGLYGQWEARFFGQQTTNYGNDSVSAAYAFYATVKASQSKVDGIWMLQVKNNEPFKKGPLLTREAMGEEHVGGKVIWGIWFRENLNQSQLAAGSGLGNGNCEAYTVKWKGPAPGQRRPNTWRVTIPNSLQQKLGNPRDSWITVNGKKYSWDNYDSDCSGGNAQLGRSKYFIPDEIGTGQKEIKVYSSSGSLVDSRNKTFTKS